MASGQSSATPATTLGCQQVDRFPTVQAAVAAAGPNGCVIIPSTYKGSDSYSNASGVSVLDLRGGQLRVWQQISTSRPAVDSEGRTVPLGHDLALFANGPADIHLRNECLFLHSRSSVTRAGSTTIDVGNTAKLYTAGGLIINQYQPDEETVGSVFTISSPSTLTATFKKPHAQPFTVTQCGSLRFEGYLMQLFDNDNLNPTFYVQNIGTSSGADREFEWGHSSQGLRFFRSGIDGDHIPRWYGKINAGGRFYGSDGGSGSTGGWDFYDNDKDNNLKARIDPTGAITASSFTTGKAGTPLTRYARYASKLSPASVSPNTCTAQKFTFKGLVPADVLIGVNKPTDQTGLSASAGHVIAADTATINFCNNTTSPITPSPNETYNIVVVQ